MSEPFVSWAVVEVMGHVRMAGMVSEQTIGGASFVRVDVPECPAIETRYHTAGAIPAFTRLLGSGSIYSITPCTEDVARRAAETFRTAPITQVDLIVRDEPKPAVIGHTPPATDEPPDDRDEDDYDDPDNDEF